LFVAISITGRQAGGGSIVAESAGKTRSAFMLAHFAPVKGQFLGYHKKIRGEHRFQGGCRFSYQGHLECWG
jgi:hypothetical protein